MRRVLIVAYYFPPIGGIGSIRLYSEFTSGDPQVIRIAPVLQDRSATSGARHFAASHACEHSSGGFGSHERR
jgi:hypothetical protein